MAISLQKAPDALRTYLLDAEGVRRGRPRPWLVALFAYLALDLVYFGIPVLPHLGSACACGVGGDPPTYMWFMSWWPHALLHGHNPFLTDALFAPDRVSLGAVDEVPGLALLGTPVTLLFGPLVAYNLWALAAPVLAATFAFVLCRYVTRRLLPALIGGYIFGFSPYMLGHMQGHLDLVLVFPIPAAVYLVLRRLDADISTRRFVIWMGLLLAFFFLCSQELTVTLVLTGALALLLTYAFVVQARVPIKAAVPAILGAGGLALVLTGVFIYYALSGDLTGRFFNRYSDTIVADGLGFFLPTDAEAVGHSWFASTTSKFSGGIPEDGVYLGPPLLLVTLGYVVTSWRRPLTRVLTALLAVLVVLMLGSHLRIAGGNQFHIGSHHTIPLPWYALSRLPFFREIAPARLGVYMFLTVALVAAMWLALPRRGWPGRLSWIAAGLGIALLVPNIGNGGWHTRLPNPALFTDERYRHAIPSGAGVLALPFAGLGDSQLWQAEMGFRFRLAEGYVGALIPNDYDRDVQLSPAFSEPAAPPDPGAVRTYLEHRRVKMVVVDPVTAPLWPPALKALGLTGRSVGGALVYDVPRR